MALKISKFFLTLTQGMRFEQEEIRCIGMALVILPKLVLNFYYREKILEEGAHAHKD